MSLKLMYITNNPEIAKIAQSAGVDRIFIDMEYIGKEERQAGIDTVKSHHTVEDIKTIRTVLTTAELLVRVNPIHDATEHYCSSKKEIDQVIDAGADVIMLPMFRTADEARLFVEYVDGRAKTMLLVENSDAVKNIDSILDVEGIDELHIGLNDLHLSYGLTFMFELLSNGTIKNLCEKFRLSGKKYGFGGIARIGYGDLPAEYIITEHYLYGSQMAILSRGFCNAKEIKDTSVLKTLFVNGVNGIRDHERKVMNYTEKQFLENHNLLCEKVEQIVTRIRENE